MSSALARLPVVIVTVLVIVAGFFIYHLLDDSPAEKPVEEASVGEVTTGTASPESPKENLQPESENPPDEVSRTAAEERSTAEEVQVGSEAKITIRGRLLDGYGRGLPVINIKVMPHQMAIFLDESSVMKQPSVPLPWKTTSGDDGTFVIRGSETDRHMQIEYLARDFQRKLDDLPHPLNQSVDLGDIRLEAGCTLSGLVLDPRGNPIEGADVRTLSKKTAQSGESGVFMIPLPNMNASREVKTDASGYFEVTGLAPGKASLTATAGGYAMNSMSGLDVSPERPLVDVRITLEPGRTISGVVVDENEVGLEDVEVVAMPHHSLRTFSLMPDETSLLEMTNRPLAVETDATGHFQITGLQDLPHSLTATRPGLQRRRIEGVKTGQGDITIQMMHSGTLWGLVQDGADRTPIHRFSIMPRDSHAEVLTGSEAAAEVNVEEQPGLYAIVNIEEKALHLTVKADGFTGTNNPGVEVPAGQLTRFDLMLSRESTVSGVVLDPEGQPVNNAWVSVRTPTDSSAGSFGMSFSVNAISSGSAGDFADSFSGNGVEKTKTDENGLFAFKKLGSGPREVLATHSIWACSEPSAVELHPGGSIDDLVIQLRAGGALEGTTFDADGLVLPNSGVWLTKKRGVGGLLGMLGMNGPPQDDGERELRTNSGPDGKYHLEGILPGDYEARINTDTNSFLGGGGGEVIMAAFAMGGPESNGIPVTIREGKTTSLDLALTPTGALEGIVSDTSGPVADVALTLRNVDAFLPIRDLLGGGLTARTDEMGNFNFENVAPGEYKIMASPVGAARPIERLVKIRARETTHKNILLPGGMISGRVTDASTGDPIPNVTIQVEADNGEDGGHSTVRSRSFVSISMSSDSGPGGNSMDLSYETPELKTDEDGRYSVRYLDAGEYEVTIRGPVIEMNRGSVTVMDGGSVNGINFKADRGAKLLVTPVGALTNDLMFVSATLTSEDDPSDTRTQAQAGGDSKITFEGLPHGNYRIELNGQSLNGGQVQGSTIVALTSGEARNLEVQMQQ